MEQEKAFDHLKCVRQVARELALTRAETDAWIEGTITEIEKTMEEKAENA